VDDFEVFFNVFGLVFTQGVFMSRQQNLIGKVAVITGASRGIGQLIAVRLAEAGAAVALIARSGVALQETVSKIQQTGGKAAALPADIGQIDSLGDLKSRVENELGRVSILINGAGVFGPIMAIKDTDPREWIETMNINAIAPFVLCQAFVGGMIDQGWGRIVNVTSAASLHAPGPYYSAYSTSKVTMNHFTRHLAAELQGTGVTANVIHPGEVKTEMWAYIRDMVNQMGPEVEGYQKWAQWVDETGGDDPEKSADLVLKLMRDESAAINGQFLWIEAGLQKPTPSW
jgi:NAD(P)-dependent dehydrogenase (short-subunit alcohol dehydrogenase family)